MMAKKKKQESKVWYSDWVNNQSQFDAGRTKNANKQNQEQSIFSKPRWIRWTCTMDFQISFNRGKQIVAPSALWIAKIYCWLIASNDFSLDQRLRLVVIKGYETPFFAWGRNNAGAIC